MPVGAAMFLFLAAIAVAVFAFLSIVTWVSAPAKERLARDRFALLKTLAEQQGENVTRVLEILQREDKERRQKQLRDERRNWIDGGVVLIAIGVGLGAMLAIVGSRAGEWSVGLIPFLLGLALLITGLVRETRTKKSEREAE